jgi:hypothetical protein
MDGSGIIQDAMKKGHPSILADLKTQMKFLENQPWSWSRGLLIHSNKKG